MLIAMEATQPKIQNIKAHFCLSHQNNLKSYLLAKCNAGKISLKFHHNFAVVRSKYVYIIWYQSGFVNVTKIKSEKHVKRACKHLYKILDLPYDLCHSVVDNITASGKFNHCLNLRKLAIYLENNNFKIKYNRYKFPAIFVKVFNCGTFTIFGSGSYNIIGCRSINNLMTVFEKSVNHIQKWHQHVNII